MYKYLLLFLLFPLTFYGQVTFTEVPVNNQLVARDPGDNDRGIVSFQGEVDRGGSEPDYEQIRIKVFRNGNAYNTSTKTLSYSSNKANFTFSLKIKSEKRQYSFEVYGLQSGETDVLITTINDVVAGDVYIIQGQSNAVAQPQDVNDSSSSEENQYIRVYGSGTEKYLTLKKQEKWYEGVGDATRGKAGNVGQWGIKLARLLLDNTGFPIAIFNGARGARSIDYFPDNGPLETGDAYKDEPAMLPNGKDNNNFWRLQYRLEKTGLEDNVRAVFWSQGEKTSSSWPTSVYKNYFIAIKNDWDREYRNLEMFYIFQTRYCQGCNSSNTDYFDQIMETKEAQRQLAFENSNIQIMPANALNLYYGDGEGWHFEYSGGYEFFGTRIYELVIRDLYTNNNPGDFEAPMIMNSVLINGTTLTLWTNSSSLSMDSGMTTEDFVLSNAGGATITDVAVSGSDVVLTLSKDPGSSAKISYTAQRVDDRPPTYPPAEFIKNSKGIELICFNKYPIKERADLPVDPTWNGNSWSPSAPSATTDAIIEGNYKASDGSFTAKNLTIKPGAVLDFDNGTSNSVIVYEDLTIEGTFNIGDKESLVMYDKRATITGDITKYESSTSRTNVHDFTYWSSPVEAPDALIKNVFPGVNPNRIFYYDQSKSSVTDPNTPGYWDVWVKAPQTMRMAAGQGFAAEGRDNGVHSIAFTGKPNNGNVTVSVFYQNTGNVANLIGNPYPSAIDITKFLKAHNNVFEAYLWTHNTPIIGESGDYADDYATINENGLGTATCEGCPIPDENIGSSQGFFVTTSNSNSLTFTNDMRMEEANDQFFKSSNSKTRKKDKDNGVQIDGKIWLNLKTDQGGFNQILIVFKEGLSNKVDVGYDTEKFSNSNNPISFYSIIDKEKYVIQGLRTFAKNRRVKLGFDTSVAPRKFTIAIEKTEGVLKKSDVYLVDNTLKKTHNLSKSAYEFEQETIGDYPERFVLKFTGDKSDDKDTLKKNKNDFKVHNGSFGMTIRANNRVKRLKIFDIYGKRIINMRPNSKYFTINTSKIKRGTVVVVEATFKKGNIVRKKTIKY